MRWSGVEWRYSEIEFYVGQPLAMNMHKLNIIIIIIKALQTKYYATKILNTDG